MQGHTDKKDEKTLSSAPKEIPVSSSIRNAHLGALAYAAIPQIAEKEKKELEKKEEVDFQKLYSGKRITSFPKSPQTVSVKLPAEIKTIGELKAEIKKIQQDDKTNKRLVELENIDKKIQQNNDFKVQFDQLVGCITAWSITNEKIINTRAVAESFEFFRTNLFTDEFAGMQDSLYFEELKYLLEKFYLDYLLDDSIPGDVKAKKLHGLLPHLMVCGPGAHSHLQDDMNINAGVFSIEKALTGYRTQVVKGLASKYVFETTTTQFIQSATGRYKEVIHRVQPGDEIHVPISYLKLAKQLGLNPDFKEAQDSFHINTKLDEKDGTNDFFTNPESKYRKKFEIDFKKEFNYENITNDMLDRLISALFDAIKTEILVSNKAAEKENKDSKNKFDSKENFKLNLIPELKKEGDYWPINSASVMNIVKSTLESAGIELDEEFLKYNDKGTHAEFRKDLLRDRLMAALMKKGVFAEGVIFDKKIYFYVDYLPQISAVQFVEKVHHKGMSGEIVKLMYLPEQVRDTLIARLYDMEIEGAQLLKAYRTAKQVLMKNDIMEVTKLIKMPGIDLNLEVDGNSSIWTFAVISGNIKACELCIDTKTIPQGFIDSAFAQQFRANNFKFCRALIGKNTIRLGRTSFTARLALELKNEQGCQLLLESRIITQQDYNDAFNPLQDSKATLTATAAAVPGFFRFPLGAISKDLEKDNQTLLENVLWGNKDGVEMILNKNPLLVLDTGRAKDYSGREIEGTAYQMALGACDVNRVKLDKDNKPVFDAKGNIQVFHADEGMAELIKSYFIKACNNDEKIANEEIQKQQEEQFPGGFEAYENSKDVKEAKDNDLKALRVVVEAIMNADVKLVEGGKLDIDQKCEAALTKFREHLKPNRIIRTGKHFNFELLAEAFKLYDDKKRFKDFGGSHLSPKNALMWRNVVGYIERYLPANLAYIFCRQKIDSSDVINSEAQKFSRNLALFDSSRRFFPLDQFSKKRLGFDGGIWQGHFKEYELTWNSDAHALAFTRFCLGKNIALMQQCHPQPIKGPDLKA